MLPTTTQELSLAGRKPGASSLTDKTSDKQSDYQPTSCRDVSTSVKVLRRPGNLFALAGTAVAICAAAAIGISTLSSQTKAEPKRQACIWLNNPQVFAVFTQAYQKFHDRWLIIGADWFQSYEIGGAAKHPLLGRPREDMGTVKGYVWARDVRCETWQLPQSEVDAANKTTRSLSKLQNTPDAPALQEASEVWGTRIIARSVTFSEEGNAWTPAISQGVLWEVFIARENGTWRVEDNTLEAGILSVGAKERRPTPLELPPRKAPLKWRN